MSDMRNARAYSQHYSNICYGEHDCKHGFVSPRIFVCVYAYKYYGYALIYIKNSSVVGTLYSLAIESLVYGYRIITWSVFM